NVDDPGDSLRHAGVAHPRVRVLRAHRDAAQDRHRRARTQLNALPIELRWQTDGRVAVGLPEKIEVERKVFTEKAVRYQAGDARRARECVADADLPRGLTDGCAHREPAAARDDVERSLETQIAGEIIGKAVAMARDERDAGEPVVPTRGRHVVATQ